MRIFVEGRCVADNVVIADTFWRRFIGLMGKRALPPTDGLLLMRCGSIHTCFMRFPIDVIYLSKEMTVLDTETVRPWRTGKRVRHAGHTLELCSGNKEHFKIGSIVEIR